MASVAFGVVFCDGDVIPSDNSHRGPGFPEHADFHPVLDNHILNMLFDIIPGCAPSN